LTQAPKTSTHGEQHLEGAIHLKNGAVWGHLIDSKEY